MKQILLAVLLLCALTIRGFSQQAATGNQTYNFSIQECVDYAYQHQHDVINSKLDVNSADFHVKEIIGQGLPQVTGSANFLDYLKIPTTLIPGEFFNQPGTFVPLKFGVTYQSNLGANVSQILFDPNYIVGLQGRKTY